MVAHLTVDKKGVRGDEPGFDKKHIATYGLVSEESNDFIGQTTWGAFASSLGWRQGDKPNWPTAFNYNDPRFAQTMVYMKSLSDKGFAPKIGQFTTSPVEQLGAKKIAMATGGSWDASTYAKLPGIKVGIARTVIGPDGKRAVLSNSNGNNIWAGSGNKENAWKWISFMGVRAMPVDRVGDRHVLPVDPGLVHRDGAGAEGAGRRLVDLRDTAEQWRPVPGARLR
jgi:hypothetical protein